jgi:hypothetical protein
MQGALSAISGHIRRSLVIGTFTPVVLFGAISLAVVGPVLPFGDVDFRLLLDVQNRSFVLLIVALLTVTGLLHNLNTPIIRLYEGYPWSESVIGRWRRSVHARRRDMLHARWRGLLRTFSEAEATIKLDPAFTLSRSVGRRVNYSYPQKAEVLPTALGNVIRTFEEYPDLRYGIAAITMWPRLTAVMDRNFADAVDESKTSFDFMINCSFLSGLLAVFLLASTLLFPARLFVLELAIPTLAIVATLLTAAAVAYQGAINQAYTWGDMVRSSYDLYRRKLLADLGYAAVPRTAAQEWTTWDAISRHMLFGDTGRVALPCYGSGLAVTAARHAAALSIVRMIRSVDADGVELCLVVRNGADESVRDVLVESPVESGWFLLEASVSSSATLRVHGGPPYSFVIPEIQPASDISVTYRVVEAKLKREVQ